MPEQQDRLFTFVSQGLASDTFQVIRFSGSEAISDCYRFEIHLVSSDPELDMHSVLEKPATFTILRKDGDIPFHGILAEFEQLNKVDVYTVYRAVLVPKFWWLSLTHHNQVFLSRTVTQILEACLKDAGLTDLDFELRLQRQYPEYEYVCQYRESHSNFVSRWMEREGIYYYFEQNPGGEKLILTDTQIAHTSMPEGRQFRYTPIANLESLHREEIIYAFSYRQRAIPASLVLKDYNYRTPSLELVGKADVSPHGRGEVYVYGEHFRTPQEGNKLAEIRAEGLRCRHQQCQGASMIPYLRPGYIFDLTNHYRSSFNRSYLTTSVRHEGSQTAFLLAGLGEQLSEQEQRLYYQNQFEAIPAEIQFRPECISEKPRFYGSINAKIDAAGSGRYAELDEQGRYKVVVPFDLSGRKSGKGSAWLRMMQPYAGSDHGMHFPLHKDTEVLLTFIDGDPDRPIIAGAVPNPQNPSQVTSADQSMSKITTAGGNRIHIEDEEGSQRILLHSPTQGSFVRIGAPNDPQVSPTAPTPEEVVGHAIGIAVKTVGDFFVSANNKIEDLQTESSVVKGWRSESTYGLKTETILGAQTHMNLGSYSHTTIGDATELHLGWHNTYHNWFRKIIPFYNVIAGRVDKYFGTHLKAVSQETEMIAKKTELNAQLDELRGEIKALRASVKTVVGMVDTVEGDVKNLKGSMTEIAGDVRNLNGDVFSLELQSTAIKQSETKLANQVNQIAGQVANINQSNVNIASLHLHV